MLAAWTGGELIRLQCYEGIDAAQAVYDWDYARQLLHLRAAEISGEAHGSFERRPGGRPVPAALPHPPGAAALDRAGGGRPAGAADRRDRPRRRRVRGLPPRGAVGLADHDPRDRRVPRRRPTARRAHQQPHPRRPRRPQAAVPVPLGRTPDVRARSGDRPPPSAGGVQRPRPPGRRRRRRPAGAQPVQAAGCRRDDRLGRRPRPPRCQRARRAVRGDHPRRRAQVPRGPRTGRPARLRRHRQAGGRPVSPAGHERCGARRRRRNSACASPTCCAGSASTHRSAPWSRSPKRSVPSASVAATTCTGPGGRRSCGAPRTSMPTTGRSPPSSSRSFGRRRRGSAEPAGHARPRLRRRRRAARPASDHRIARPSSCATASPRCCATVTSPTTRPTSSSRRGGGCRRCASPARRGVRCGSTPTRRADSAP